MIFKYFGGSFETIEARQNCCDFLWKFFDYSLQFNKVQNYVANHQELFDSWLSVALKEGEGEIAEEFLFTL